MEHVKGNDTHILHMFLPFTVFDSFKSINTLHQVKYTIFREQNDVTNCGSL